MSVSRLRLDMRSTGARVLAMIAFAAWCVTAALADSMHGMTGTMGLGMLAFVGVWTLMMAAMMLPSVAPVAFSYQRVIKSTRALRLASFVGGYAGVWALAGLVAFGVGRISELLVEADHGHLLASGVFAMAALYQVSPLKDRCLKHCRSPISLLMRYSSYEGRLRDAAAGAHHGAYCVGCCWAMFAVLIVVGAMSLPVMIVLGAVVFLEKVWAHGVGVSRVVAAACAVVAMVILIEPSLIPELVPMNPEEMRM